MFKPLPRQGSLEARKRNYEGQKFKFRGRWWRINAGWTLGGDDLLVLLAICAFGCVIKARVDATQSESHRVALEDLLECKGRVINANHVLVEVTRYALLLAVGMADGGENYQFLKDSLKRLRTVHYTDHGAIDANTEEEKSGSDENLLGYKTNASTGEIQILLNARFAAAILGGEASKDKIWGGPRVKINLDESRAISHTARILHTRLSVASRSLKRDTDKGPFRIRLDTLAKWLYGDDEPPMKDVAPKGTDPKIIARLTKKRLAKQRRYRREVVREVLIEINGQPSWQISETPDRDMAIVYHTDDAELPDTVVVPELLAAE
jgi:hypothetical protein